MFKDYEKSCIEEENIKLNNLKCTLTKIQRKRMILLIMKQGKVVACFKYNS